MWQITSWWDCISAVSSGILALGIIAVIWQVCLLKKQNRLNAFNSVLQQWGGIEERKTRRYVMKEFKFDKEDSLEDLNEDCLDKVELVLATCDRTSFLALKVPKSEKDIVEFVGRSMIQIWNKTQTFIKARRKRRNEPEEGKPGSYVYFFQQFVMRNRRELE